MHRRDALQFLLRSMAAGALVGPSALFGQDRSGAPAGVVQAGPRAAPAPGALGARPQAQFQSVSPEVKAVLDEWQQHTRSIQRLHGEFDRYVYDGTYLVEKRAVGEFFYEAPDLGRIDFRPCPPEKLPEPNQNGQRINPLKLGANGQPYTVQADSSSSWVCRGDALLYIDVDQKTYEVLEIPAHMRGKNIINSPMPFLFGMPADEMEKRYYLSLGSKHNPKRRVIHLVAYPKMAAAAKEWSRAEVLLDPGTHFKDVYLPTAIKLLDPTGQTESVYVFHLEDGRTKLNPRFFFRDPFRDPGWLSGYKCTGTHRVACEDEEQKTVEVPQQTTPNGLFR